MSREEKAVVSIPRKFQSWFAGAKEVEILIFDIESSPFAGGEIGTIKIFSGAFSGTTFAVRRNDTKSTVKDQWRIVA